MVKREKFVLHLKHFTLYGLLLGFIIGLASIFVSGIIQSYLVFVGGSLVVSFTIIFLFSLFMLSMENVTDAPNNYQNIKQNIHNFQVQTNRIY